MSNNNSALELVQQPQRLKVLHDLGILDTEPEPRFDRITSLVADVLEMPIALISFVDSDRQWFKSACGFKDSETDISESICAYAINEPELLVVENTLEHERFKDHPAVVGDMAIRFYAGAVLHSRSGHPLGTLCIIDLKPRKLNTSQRRQLLSFARLVESEIWEDIADIQARAQSRLADHIDPLTGFFSLDEFSHRYQQCLQHVKESEEKWSFGSLLLINLPQLDFVYRVKGLDAYLHLVLPVAKSIAGLLVNSNAFFGRYERDGFLVFVPSAELSSQQLSTLVSERLQQDSAIVTLLEQTSIHCSVAPALSDLDRTLHCCEMAAHGTNNDNGLVCTSFTPQDSKRLARESSIGLKLMDALDDDMVKLFFQPKATVATCELSGMEALIRWHDDELGTVRPLEIVKAAERLDKTTALDDWVIRSSVAQISVWQTAGLEVVPVSVNLSNESLLDEHLVDRIGVVLESFNVDSSLLNVEVLETALFNDIDAITPLMHKLVDAGIALSLDDFGVEYSSFRYLQRLPVSTVKIDRSFVSQITVSSDDAMLVKGIIDIAHSLGMKTVAEGVETEEQFTIIKQFACDSIQGNYFSEALAEQDAALLLGAKSPSFAG